MVFYSVTKTVYQKKVKKSKKNIGSIRLIFIHRITLKKNSKRVFYVLPIILLYISQKSKNFFI